MFDTHRGVQAVLEAYSTETESRKQLAAVLRAATTVFDRPRRSDACESWNDGFQYAQNVCRAELLEIANALENHER